MDNYLPPFLHRNGHLATILPNKLRPLKRLMFLRKTIPTLDKDFIDVDTIQRGAKNAVILLHGLEGSSHSQYIQGMAHALASTDCDVLCMNFRGCSGRVNATFQSYHSGKTDDLNTLIKALTPYESIHLIGFSLGGNVALKYMGENTVDPRIKSCVAISTPIDLAGSSIALNSRENRMYLNRFLRQLKFKAIEKAQRFPEKGLETSTIRSARNFEDFDNLYTAPAHGFNDAKDYYKQSSSKQFLKFIDKPTLIISALNDSFLSSSCYPTEACEENDHLTLLTPRFGGHVGFATDTLMRKQFWHEQKAIEFIANFTA